MLAYLAGAIEYSPDSGRRWRREITPFLKEQLGHDVYDPAEDERKSLTEEEQKHLRSWKRTDFARFQAAVRKIILWDLDIVSRSDYVVCYLDEHALKGGGTSAELSFAFHRDIPVYVVSPLPVTEISGWILGCTTRIFAGFDDLKEFLRTRYPADTLASV
jgi:nucleoside 2-deoxyribosyltransferase